MTTRAENYGFPPDEIPLCMICLQPLETSEHQPVPWPGGSGLAHYECAAAEDEYAEWDDAGRPGGRRSQGVRLVHHHRPKPARGPAMNELLEQWERFGAVLGVPEAVTAVEQQLLDNGWITKNDLWWPPDAKRPMNGLSFVNAIAWEVRRDSVDRPSRQERR